MPADQLRGQADDELILRQHPRRLHAERQVVDDDAITLFVASGEVLNRKRSLRTGTGECSASRQNEDIECLRESLLFANAGSDDDARNEHHTPFGGRRVERPRIAQPFKHVPLDREAKLWLNGCDLLLGHRASIRVNLLDPLPDFVVEIRQVKPSHCRIDRVGWDLFELVDRDRLLGNQIEQTGRRSVRRERRNAVHSGLIQARHRRE